MKSTRLLALIALALPALAQAASAPQYVITDLGAVGGNLYSQAFGMSASGNYVVGRTLAENGSGNPWPAFSYSTAKGSMTAQDLPTGRDFAAAYGVNDGGVSVGAAALTASGAAPVPVMWNKGAVTQLAMPAGQTGGRAYDINNNGIAVGSVGGGTSEQATIFNTQTGQATVISAFSAQGSFMQTAFAINDAGIVVGFGVGMDGRSVALSYNTNTRVMTELGLPAYAGFNSAGAYGISESGYVVGTSGNGKQAVMWAPGSTTPIMATLPSISSSGNLGSVNNDGWAVGSSGGVYSNPFLYADGQTYLISSLLVNGEGWNFSTTTSASAEAIANNGAITGTARFNGVEHAYLMTLAPVPEPGTYALMLAGLAGLGFVARRARRA